ncbi:g1153 [Coccomyxa elongata]
MKLITSRTASRNRGPASVATVASSTTPIIPDLQGKRVLVTGGSAGIGKAAAYAFDANGCSVAVLGRRIQRLDAVVVPPWQQKRTLKLSDMLDSCWRASRRAEAGAAMLEQATEDRSMLNSLEPLDEDLLQTIVAGTSEAFTAAHAVPLIELGAKHVQTLAVSLLNALKTAHPNGSMQPLDTHATGLNAPLHRCKPDIVVSDCCLPLGPHIVEFYECKTHLGESSAQQDAAYQMDERRRQLLPEQRERGEFWGCSIACSGEIVR